MMTPAFHFRVLSDYLSTFNNNATLLVERVDKLTAKEPAEPIPAFRLTQNCALDIITSECARSSSLKIRSGVSDIVKNQIITLTS